MANEIILLLVALVVAACFGLRWLFVQGWAGAFNAGLKAYKKGRYGEAEKHLLRALKNTDELATNDKKRLATLNFLGETYWHLAA
jgi:hypothetical protein